MPVSEKTPNVDFSTSSFAASSQDVGDSGKSYRGPEDYLAKLLEDGSVMKEYHFNIPWKVWRPCALKNWLKARLAMKANLVLSYLSC